MRGSLDLLMSAKKTHRFPMQEARGKSAPENGVIIADKYPAYKESYLSSHHYPCDSY